MKTSRTSIAIGTALIGLFVLGLSAESAKAQCYAPAYGGYYGGYGGYYVAPAPVYVPPPVIVAPRVYYPAPVYRTYTSYGLGGGFYYRGGHHGRRAYYGGHHGYHGRRAWGFNFGFGYAH